jgi:hypothetical protein
MKHRLMVESMTRVYNTGFWGNADTVLQRCKKSIHALLLQMWIRIQFSKRSDFLRRIGNMVTLQNVNSCKPLASR